jgi:proteasome lid subunit RPN8/RPN11
MRNIIHSAVPLSYLTSPSTKKVVRVENPRDPLDEAILDNMVSGCRANRDEVCGFITDAEDILYVPNSHMEPHFNFYMAIEDIQEALQIICKINQQNVIGVFHTHVNNVPWPTPIDLAGWPNPDLRWRYWIATNHEVIEWSLPR